MIGPTALAFAQAQGFTSPEVLVPAVVAILSGGFVGACVAVYRAKQTVPAERDNLVVSGAETAVLSLERSLAAETRRAERAEASLVMRDEVIAAKERRIEALERQLEKAQQLLDAVREELHEIRMSG